MRLLYQAIERHVRGWARRVGVREGRGDGVAVLKRFGGSVNLNLHVHALVLDGVFARAADGRLRFHSAPVPTATDLAEILATVAPRVRRLLTRDGRDDQDTADLVADAAPLFAGWAAASIAGQVVQDGRPQRPRRLGNAATVEGVGPDPRTATPAHCRATL